MKRVVPWLLAAFLAFSGCGGSGYKMESSCKSSGRSGTCMVTFSSLSGGPYRHKIETPGEFSWVDVTAHISAEKGSLQVWWEDPQRKKIMVNVEPGQTSAIQGTAWLDTISDKRSFYIYFEPLGEGEAKRAEDVHAEIHYNLP